MKMYSYAMSMIGLVLLLNVAGIDIGTGGIEGLIGMATGEIQITTSSLWDALFQVDIGALVLGAVGTIVAGFVLKGRLENFIILPFLTGYLIFLVQVYQGIMNYALQGGETWTSWIVLLLLAPLTIGFIISCVEFFRGND